MEDRLLGIDEASKILGIHLETLRRWSNEGKVETVLTPGGHRRYRQSDIEILVKGRKMGAPVVETPEGSKQPEPVTLRCSEEFAREILGLVSRLVGASKE